MTKDYQLSFQDYRQIFSSFTLIPFEDGCVLFNETEQSVLLLNHSAAVIWSASFEVDSLDELVDFIAGQFAISVVRARRDVEQFFDSFKSSQLFLTKEAPAGSFLKPVAEKLFVYPDENDLDELYLSVNHHCFKVSVSVGALKEELLRIFTHFICSADSIPASNTICSIMVVTNGDYYSIYVDRICVFAELPFNGLVPFLFGIIFETLWLSGTERDDADDRLHLMFHAAVLGVEPGKMVLFPGVPGAGKSTLAAVLAAKGWQFFSDELAFVFPQAFRVLPCPLPVCVKQGAVSFLSDYYPEISDFKLHHRLDDKRACYLPLKNPELSTGVNSGADIIALIFPRYEQNNLCTLEPLAKATALENLLDCGSSGRPVNREELTAVVQMVEELPCYYLHYSDIDTALEAVNKVLKESCNL